MFTPDRGAVALDVLCAVAWFERYVVGARAEVEGSTPRCSYVAYPATVTAEAADPQFAVNDRKPQPRLIGLPRLAAVVGQGDLPGRRVDAQLFDQIRDARTLGAARKFVHRGSAGRGALERGAQRLFRGIADQSAAATWYLPRCALRRASSPATPITTSRAPATAVDATSMLSAS